MSEKSKYSLIQTSEIKSTWENFPSTIEDEIEFHNWFSACKDISELIADGYSDFFHKIFTEKEHVYLGRPAYDASCLEIGYGGGRLILPAASIFKNVVGIDIHHEEDRVNRFLRDNNVENFNLLHQDNIHKVENNSIDFVFSYIVFQHFDNWKEAEFYLKHAYRVLRPNGIIKIFLPFNNTMYPERGFISSIDYEDIIEKQAYSLWVNPNFAKSKFESLGFRFLKMNRSKKRAWQNNTKENRSNQFFVLAQKDA